MDEPTIPLPIGTRIFTAAPHAKATAAVPSPTLAVPVSVELSAPSSLTIETRTENAEDPQAFTPSAPPTPKEEAEGKRVIYYTVAAIICGVIALACFYTKHWMAGVLAAVGGAGLHLMGTPLAAI